MAWEQRGNKVYYYRKRREGDHVVSEYVGNDFSAQLFSETDRQECEQLLVVQKKWRDEKSEIRVIESDYEFLTAIVDELVRATLLTSGYHPHKGQWRKKRYD